MSNVAGRTAFAASANVAREAFWRDESVAVVNELPDLIPIDNADVDAEAYPALRAQVRGHEEALRVEAKDEILVAGSDLAVDRLASVAVMVVEVVREGLAAHLELDVLDFARGGFGEGERDLANAGTRVRSSAAGWHRIKASCCLRVVAG